MMMVAFYRARKLTYSGETVDYKSNQMMIFAVFDVQQRRLKPSFMNFVFTVRLHVMQRTV